MEHHVQMQFHIYLFHQMTHFISHQQQYIVDVPSMTHGGERGDHLILVFVRLI